MARLLAHVVEPPRACPYLATERAELEHYLLAGITPVEMEHLLAHGYRRFGGDYFRPACSTCVQCEPTRIVCDAFAPGRTQRRIARLCAALRIEVATPSVDDARMRLYRAWHADRESSRDWEPNEMSPEAYADHFLAPHPCAREIAYYDGDRLVGVGLVDETPNAYSAIYFYYDPTRSKLSLGTYNVLALVARAQRERKQHVYLGFKVQGCPSLAYKGTFHAQETLVGRPPLRAPATWARVDRAAIHT